MIAGALGFLIFFAAPVVTGLVPGAMQTQILSTEAKAQNRRRYGRQPGRRGRSRGVPEISAPAGLSVLALLGCFVMIYRSRHQ